MLADWFPTLSGVRQGDSGSPTMFAYFINDLVDGLKGLNNGIKSKDGVTCCLLQADYIMLLSANDMQDMLNLMVTVKVTLNLIFEDTCVHYTMMYKYLGVNLH